MAPSSAALITAMWRGRPLVLPKVTCDCPRKLLIDTWAEYVYTSSPQWSDTRRAPPPMSKGESHGYEQTETAV